MQLINKCKNKISKKEIAFICAFSIMFVVNYFIFNQFDILLNNPAEFSVTVAEGAWSLIWRPIVILVVVISALTALCCYSKKGFVYTVATLLGLVLAGYIQVLFMNNDVMNVLSVARIGQYIVNTLLYLFIVSVPIIIVFFERRAKKGFTPKLALTASLVILGMQLFGVISVAATAPQAAKDNELYYFSVDEQLKLSKNNNIIVFVMDQLDTIYSDAVFEKYSNAKKIFSGFTYYTDNISEYPQTFPSITSLLTGKQYDGTINKQIDYYKNSWNDEVLLGSLKKNNYTRLGLLDTTTTFYDFNDLDGKFDNIKKINKKYRIVNGKNFFGEISSYAFMRQSPIVFKPIIAWKGESHSVKIKNTPDYFPHFIAADADLLLYSKLYNGGLRNGLSADREENVFSFVHMRAGHAPFEYNENLKKTNKSNAVSQAYGSFKILDEYFSQMKDLGIYDDSTIIVLGDHGWGRGKNSAEVVSPPMTSLFVKESVKKDPKGKDGEELRIPISQPQLSHRNFASTILEIIGYVHEGEQRLPPSYFDVIKGKNAFDELRGNIDYTDIVEAGVQTRYFYFVKYMNLASSKFFFKYRIIGDANSIGNWKKIM